jgi:phosphoribosylanthranilate isomerase
MTKVKICGITNIEDALVAVEAGADLLGFIFYEPSPRYVRPETAAEIVAGVRGQVASGKSQVADDAAQTDQAERSAPPLFVGVFVNASPETVGRTLDKCQLDAAQLHGDEPPEFLNQFRNRAYRALRPQSVEEANRLMPLYEAPIRQTTKLPNHIPSFLIDAYHPTLYGGTGQVTDWSMAATLARRYPIMLAGSLTPANVAQAIQAVKPWGVDVSSGVEREKGRKDHQKVRDFIRAAKNVMHEDQ